MPKTSYCLYSRKRGYFIKKLDDKGQYSLYWFNNVQIFVEEEVKIFLNLQEAEHSRNFLSKFGPSGEEPIPDLRIRISGTEISLPLPEES